MNEAREPDIPDQVIESFTCAESDSGVMRWNMRGERAVEERNTGWVRITRPVIEVFGPGGRREMTLTAAQARVNRRSKDLTGGGGVRVVSRDGTVVRTDSMVWIAATQRLTTDAPVSVARHGATLTGRGFESDGSLRSYRILSDVHAHVTDIEGTFGRD